MTGKEKLSNKYNRIGEIRMHLYFLVLLDELSVLDVNSETTEKYGILEFTGLSVKRNKVQAG
jgi:hypothetical protein